MIPEHLREQMMRVFESEMYQEIKNMEWNTDSPPENPKVRDGREWAHDTLLEYQLHDPQGAIAREREEKRRTGLLKFVCHECGLGNHETCVTRNRGKRRSDCDCAHKTIKRSK